MTETKFDFDLLIEILEKVAGLPEYSNRDSLPVRSACPQYTLDEIFQDARQPTTTLKDSWLGIEVDLDKFAFHCRLLYEAGYVHTVKSMGLDNPQLIRVPTEPVAISWEGQQFLEGIRNHSNRAAFIKRLTDAAVKNGVALLPLAKEIFLNR